MLFTGDAGVAFAKHPKTDRIFLIKKKSWLLCIFISLIYMKMYMTFEWELLFWSRCKGLWRIMYLPTVATAPKFVG